MSISTIRRQVKNVAYNFSDAQVKVREATSNDPWGPSTALMSEIADLTHNPMSFTEIMSMLWKRLNDHGKNWRHVYKSLVLLDYLIKCGSDKVAQQCRENIYSIETLKDFQHIEENRDQGINVREKAKQMVSLLYDEERLKNERTKFLMTRKKFLSNSAISSDGSKQLRNKSETGTLFESELEDARPSSAGEEEMQLQIALALSKEENEKEEELRKKDDIGLQMALNESRREIERIHSLETAPRETVSSTTLTQSAIDDLLSLGIGEPVLTQQSSYQTPNPWGGPVDDPWAPSTTGSSNSTTTAGAAAAHGGSTTNNGTNSLINTNGMASSVYPSLSGCGSGSGSGAGTGAGNNDPWMPSMTLSQHQPQNSDPWSVASNPLQPTTVGSQQGQGQGGLADLMGHSEDSGGTGTGSGSGSGYGGGAAGEDHNGKRYNTKTPESFLGENSSLVNLDNLMGAPIGATKAANNPFLSGGATATIGTNPFAAQQRPSPTLNEMMVNNSSSSNTRTGTNGNTTASSISLTASSGRVTSGHSTLMTPLVVSGQGQAGMPMGMGIGHQQQQQQQQPLQPSAAGDMSAQLTNPFLL